MNERESLVQEIAQQLRDIADEVDQNQSNASSHQHWTIVIYSLMYCCDFYLKFVNKY